MNICNVIARNVVALGLLLLAGCASASGESASGGWLLIVPPLTADGHPATDLPLSKWGKVGAFASQVDCTTKLQNQQFYALQQVAQITQAFNYYQQYPIQVLAGRCVSTGDFASAPQPSATADVPQ